MMSDVAFTENAFIVVCHFLPGIDIPHRLAGAKNRVESNVKGTAAEVEN